MAATASFRRQVKNLRYHGSSLTISASSMKAFSIYDVKKDKYAQDLFSIAANEIQKEATRKLASPQFLEKVQAAGLDTQSFGIKDEIKKAKKEVQKIVGKLNAIKEVRDAVNNMANTVKNIPSEMAGFKNKINARLSDINSKMGGIDGAITGIKNELKGIGGTAGKEIGKRLQFIEAPLLDLAGKLNALSDKIQDSVNNVKDGLGNVSENIKGGVGRVGDKIGNLGSTIGDGVGRVGSKIGDLGGSIVGVGEDVGDKLGKLGSELGSDIRNISGDIGDQLADFGETIGEKISGIPGGIKDLGGDIRNIGADIGAKLDPIIDEIGEFSEDIGAKLGPVKDGIIEMAKGIADVAKNVGSVGASIGENLLKGTKSGALKTKNFILDLTETLADFTRTVFNNIINNYQKVALGTPRLVRAVIRFIKDTIGNIEEWWRVVILDGVNKDDPIHIKMGKIVRNFVFWMFGTLFNIIDGPITFLINSVITGYEFFLNRFVNNAADGLLNIANKAAGADITKATSASVYGKNTVRAFAADSFGTLMGARQKEFGSLQDMFIWARGKVANAISTIVQSIVKVGGKITEGADPGSANPFRVLHKIAGPQLNKLAELQKESAPGAQNYASRIKLLIQITWRMVKFASIRIFNNVIIPIIGNVVRGVINVVKRILDTAAKFAVRFAKPVLKLAIKAIRLGPSLFSFALLEGINSVDKAQRTLKGKVTEGVTLKGDKLRNFANVFGIESDMGTLNFIYGVSLVGGVAISVVAIQGTKRLIPGGA